jgi:serine/threonine protein kinase/Tol biopolymer transport system component
MAVAAGTKLGPYEVTSPLGAGGMGEVYRARDTRLGRDVAIKVLPQHLSSNPEVRARFEREAKTISSLNHPHICTLFDVGREGDTDFLVMELVEGETLADRLAKGALATSDVLRLGSQIADALDRAHRAGVIHRDLKPGNVMLTRSGAKLMDFGLARATGLEGPAGGSGDTMSAMTQSPTVAQALTAQGTILGTFQYMAPEQLEGREADARSDVWALGCILYEMATGRRAFAGSSQASLIGAIMNTSPAPISSITPLAPPALERLVRACLEKDPNERVQTAHDVKLQLQWIAEAGSQAGVPAPVAARRRSRERLAWGAAAVASVVAAAALVIPRLGPKPSPPQVVRFNVAAPAGVSIIDDPALIEISPDGHQLAFIATDTSGTISLWVRPLESLTAHPLAGTENAAFPFWSPDSRSLGFFADGKLKKIPLEGGAAEALCDAPDGRGGSWSRSGVIVFAPMASGPIAKVSEDGGEVETLIAPDSSHKETGLRWPEFLPDGRHFLFVSLPSKQGNFDICVGALGSAGRTRLLSSATAPVYAPPGYLLFVRNGRVMMQGFDARRLALEGKPQTLGEAPRLSYTAGAHAVSVSASGVLAHPAAGLPNTKLAWFDRAGQARGEIPLPSGRWEQLGLSDDGQWLVAQRRSSPSESDLWMVEVARAVATRFTFAASNAGAPVWSPDGKWVAYNSDRMGPWDIYRKSVAGGDEEPLLQSSTLFKNVSQWTPDGSSLLYYQPDPQTGWDIWRLPLDGDRKPVPILRTRFNEYAGVVSPDGHWMAYYSDESGKSEVYVQSYPEPGRKYQASTGGGQNPLWSRDGRQILFNTADGTLMEADVETVPSFKVGRPRALFKLRQDLVGIAFAPDWSRFLLTVPAGEASAATITLEVNWAAGLKR